jgi:hypothetical protein
MFQAIAVEFFLSDRIAGKTNSTCEVTSQQQNKTKRREEGLRN